MAGTLTISTLSDGTNSTSSTNCIQGSAKAWVNFNGNGGASTRKSYNVSSITRQSAGQYTINFTNAMADANYCFTGTAWWAGTTLGLIGPNVLSTGNVTIQTSNGSAPADMLQISVAIFD